MTNMTKTVIPEIKRQDGMLDARNAGIKLISDDGREYKLSNKEKVQLERIFKGELISGEICRVSFVPSPSRSGDGTFYATDILPR